MVELQRFTMHGQLFSGVLFDLDGTLIDSLPAVERAWGDWALRHSLDPAEVVTRIHGRRSIDSVRAIAPHLDALAEDAWLQQRETEDTEGVVRISGAEDLLSAVRPMPWGIVTSGTRNVAQARLRAVGFPVPAVAVYGEDVPLGKPDPAPFRLGCLRLGLDPESVLAFEDTWAGVQSALFAGCSVVWRTDRDPIAGYEGRLLQVANYDDLKLVSNGGAVQLQSVRLPSPTAVH